MVTIIFDNIPPDLLRHAADGGDQRGVDARHHVAAPQPARAARHPGRHVSCSVVRRRRGGRVRHRD